MKKKFHLTIIITQKELEIYRQSKNVDSITLLLEQYHEYLKTFFKQNVDILFNHESQNHVINFKENI